MVCGVFRLYRKTFFYNLPKLLKDLTLLLPHENTCLE